MTAIDAQALPGRQTTRPKGSLLDPAFEALCFTAAGLLLASLAGVVITLGIGGWPAFETFGLGFLTSSDWNPVTEIYGGAGYYEFTGFPDMSFEDPAEGPIAAPADPTVNITMRLTEGEQYFVNRITFTGNSTTRDNVIRREMRLVEGGVFSTEALKYSIRRLNQLGYFQNLEQAPNAIDVRTFVLAGGRRVDVKTHFARGDAPAATAEARFLRDLTRRLYDEKIFSVVLTPNYDSRHHDHLHVDGAPYTVDGT